MLIYVIYVNPNSYTCTCMSVKKWKSWSSCRSIMNAFVFMSKVCNSSIFGCIPYYQNMSISTYESASIRVVQLWKNFFHDLAMSFLIIRTFKHLHIHVPLIQVYLNNFSIAACGLGLFRDAWVKQDITVFGRGGVNEKGRCCYNPKEPKVSNIFTLQTFLKSTSQC